MAKGLFGTDGIRGIVGEYPMTADVLLKLGWATGKALAGATSATVLIGKDTRISSYMIESALQAGLTAAGVDIDLVGPMPTPGIAYLTRTFRADKGIVISASHNLYEYNGIKFYSTEGFKCAKQFEEDILHWLAKEMVITTHELGKAKRITDAQGRYVEYCKSSVPHYTNFKGLKIIIDCANGATYNTAPYVFSELGADITTIGAKPDGMNINNNIGTNHPEVMRKHVIAEKADLGISFDGDGDRVIMVDSHGEILDGDELLYIITKHLLRLKFFKGGVIGTQMTNLGLELALQTMGIPFDRVSVGEGHVIKALQERNWELGGESSGHIVNLRTNTTADGIIAALQVLQAMKESQMDLHTIKQGLLKFPQQLVNIPHNNKVINLEQEPFTSMVKDAKSQLGKNSRVLIRYSGTEPVIRIMVEGENEALVSNTMQEMSGKIEGILKE